MNWWKQNDRTVRRWLATVGNKIARSQCRIAVKTVSADAEVATQLCFDRNVSTSTAERRKRQFSFFSFAPKRHFGIPLD